METEVETFDDISQSDSTPISARENNATILRDNQVAFLMNVQQDYQAAIGKIILKINTTEDVDEKYRLISDLKSHKRKFDVMACTVDSGTSITSNLPCTTIHPNQHNEKQKRKKISILVFDEMDSNMS